MISEQPALPLFVVGMLGLGVLALLTGDFALVWQPVPDGIPARAILAYLSGLLMLSTSLGLLFARTARLCSRILFCYLALWLSLKVPALLVAPQMEAVWLGFAEIAILFCGGWLLLARLTSPSNSTLGRFAVGENGVHLARTVFAVSLLPIGLSHIVYVGQTTELVPGWLPAPTFWAYSTGVGQILCGLALLFTNRKHLAATAEAIMLSSFAVLVWLPAIIKAPATRLPWTAFFITWVIAGSAWLQSTNIRSSKLETTATAS